MTVASALSRPAVLRVSMDCNPAAVRPAIQKVRDFLAAEGWGEKDLMSLDLALSEACNNAVKHAGDPGRKQPISVETLSDAAQVEFRVRDHTVGFQWPATTELPSPGSEGGRGLYLIASVMDHADYFRGREENILVMRKQRPAGSAPPSAAALSNENEKVISDLLDELSSCYESLSAIFRYSTGIGKTGSLKEFAEKLFNDLLRIVSADWFLVRLAPRGRSPLLAFAASDGLADPGPLHIPETGEPPHPVELEAALGRQLVWFDFRNPENKDDLLARARPGSVGLAQPILLADELLGTLAIGKAAPANPIPGRSALVFTASQTNVIGTFADFLAVQIANDRFREEQVRQRLAAHELDIASSIQRSLLPASLPQVPNFTLAAHSLNARAVGGDFYDVLRVNDNSLLLVIADVMGHGIPAAMFAAIFSTVLRAAPELTQQPAALLSRVSGLLHAELSGVEMFITAQLAYLDGRARKLTVASAGHCALAVAAAGKVKTYSPEGMPLGVLVDNLFEEDVIDLPEHSRVLLYTDGVAEAANSKGEALGPQRLLDWLRRKDADRQTAEQLKAGLVSELEKFQAGAPLKDDQTFLILAG
jgi:serine phosphatase RsbU (regulator of sigma subunit)/anti-sigma regulatory factor (Ser/Thr protein kinase)